MCAVGWVTRAGHWALAMIVCAITVTAGVGIHGGDGRLGRDRRFLLCLKLTQ